MVAYGHIAFRRKDILQEEHKQCFFKNFNEMDSN
ncbi:hypothetical protein SLEP1_g22119 [Rubroshorea leprosula]|uniref:Uncharacterized protein n=1 Tax=Rubroshorea leprosula TaxID=152421 RepID=A0AAV5JHI5_9ROSI|nr:hypothetical protein SLEP1_g22119 [Rubroshorea leprosula]